MIFHEPQTAALIPHPLLLASLDSNDYNASRACLNKYGEVAGLSNIGMYVYYSLIEKSRSS
jgi:hypothetical protein